MQQHQDGFFLVDKQLKTPLNESIQNQIQWYHPFSNHLF